jgi:hypothetical protein
MLTPGAASYTGPVSGVLNHYINATTDGLNVSASTPDWFIHSGSGNDAIAASSGTNVLDGGTGSNFLTGGTGDDTFFVDDRGPTSDIWDTVNNFHAGDAATIWGVTPSDFNLAWVDGQGAAGYTGLTLHATAVGVPTASLTLAGLTTTDITDGRLSVSYGASGGNAYMLRHGNPIWERFRQASCGVSVAQIEGEAYSCAGLCGDEGYDEGRRPRQNNAVPRSCSGHNSRPPKFVGPRPDRLAA